MKEVDEGRDRSLPPQMQRPQDLSLHQQVGRKEARKLHARQTRREGVWFGLGMFGLVGWSVAIPTLLGIALGIWIDTTWPGRFSWTLMLLVAGVMIGCFNAWYWLSAERRAIERAEVKWKQAQKKAEGPGLSEVEGPVLSEVEGARDDG